ncbi:MAG: polymer-forming cytoskeletal protein [Anaerolineae bacterium]|nr:polymer-forming cytoskeletal protein [Anaerolineae bacterium]
MSGLLLSRVMMMLVSAWLVVSPARALAEGSPPGDGIVIWNEDYTLGRGEALEGDLVVFSGDATLESGSRVDGSVVVWNGNAEVAGSIEGDLVVSGGDVHLQESAVVEGQVVCSWNCELERDPGARVDGGIVEGMPWRGLRLEQENWPSISLAPFEFWVATPREAARWAFGIVRSLAAILVVALVAGLVALILPNQSAQVRRAITEAPLPCLGFGLLTVVATVVVTVVLAVTICLSPLAVLVALALGMAGLFGWVGVGMLVGEPLLRVLNVREAVPPLSAGAGTMLITLVVAGLNFTLCLAPLGWFITLILGCIGLGAVVLTRFGTMEYRPPAPRPAPPPVPLESEDITSP